MLFVNIWTRWRWHIYFGISFILLLQMSAVSSSFMRTANNPRRFDKRWQLNERNGNIVKTKQNGWSWVNVCSVWCPKKQIIRLCSASRMTFRKPTSQKKPRSMFWTEKFQDYFSETNTSLFLGGSAFRLGSLSVYEYSICGYSRTLFALITITYLGRAGASWYFPSI